MEKVRAGEYGVFDQASGTQAIPAPELPGNTSQLAWKPYGGTGSEDLKIVVLQLSWDSAGSSAGKYHVVTVVQEPPSE